MNRSRTCIVCGRKFPDGQGIVIQIGDRIKLEFHKSRCAARFFRNLAPLLDPECVSRAIDALVKDYRERLSAEIELKRKRL